MFLFGLKMLWEAYRMDDSEADEVQKEVELELARRGSISSLQRRDVEQANEEDAKTTENTGDSTENAQIGVNKGENNAAFDKMDEVDLGEEAIAEDSSKEQSATGPASEETEKKKSPRPPQGRSVHFLDNVFDRSCKENSWFGKKCLKVFKLFINTFTMTFIAEWGDRSQLATIVLVGINNVGGVIVGGCLGHLICTGGAVLAGAVIAK